MNIDVPTGLPELPEGYYWEIRQEPMDFMYDYTIYPLTVSVCMRYKSWFRTKVIRAASTKMVEGDDIRSFSFVDPTTENILRYAEKTLTKFERSLATQRAIGEYPPKKLEGNK